MKIVSAVKKHNGSEELYLKYLPEHIAKAVAFLPAHIRNEMQEIRLRENSALSVTTPKGNYIVHHGGEITVTSEDIERTADALCENSYHVQAENIGRGFTITKEGGRAGVCGEYADVGESPRLIKITSLNIRITKFAEIPYNPVYALIAKHGLVSILIYSPPSNAKTTFLRALADTLSKGLHGLRSHRVALIDERREIFWESRMKGGLLDVYSGCPKAQGIELAVRTMNPEVIMCDEIGADDDTEALLKAQNSGVPFIATAHARDFRQLFMKPNIKKLIDCNVFEYTAGLKLNSGFTIDCNINSLSDDVFIEKRNMQNVREESESEI